MKTKVNFNAESLDFFGVVELNSTQIHKVNGGHIHPYRMMLNEWNNFWRGLSDGVCGCGYRK